jgi:hypothetical protein
MNSNAFCALIRLWCRDRRAALEVAHLKVQVHLRIDPSLLGAAFYILTVLVPVLLITHVPYLRRAAAHKLRLNFRRSGKASAKVAVARFTMRLSQWAVPRLTDHGHALPVPGTVDAL